MAKKQKGPQGRGIDPVSTRPEKGWCDHEHTDVRFKRGLGYWVICLSCGLTTPETWNRVPDALDAFDVEATRVRYERTERVG